MTELLRGAGIIDKHIAEFEKWRLIDPPDDTKNAGKMIEDLVRDIAAVLEQEPVMKQTIITPIVTRETPREWAGEARVGSFTAVKDSMGHLIVSPRIEVERGDSIWPRETTDFHTIIDIEDLYVNDVVIAKMLTIEKE